MNWAKEASSSPDFGRFGLNLKGFLVKSGGSNFRRGNLPLNPLELVSKGKDSVPTVGGVRSGYNKWVCWVAYTIYLRLY